MDTLFSNKKTIFVLVIVLMLVLLFALYYYVVKPKQDEVQSMQIELEYLEGDIALLEQQLVSLQANHSQSKENEFELRKKVPATRAIDALLLAMEEIEYATDSRIESIEFNNYDTLVSTSSLSDPNKELEVEQTEVMTETEQQQEIEPLPMSTIATELLPSQLKLITYHIQVMSPSNEKLQQFIKELETLERTMYIEMIEFSLPGEENDYAEEATNVVEGSIQVTTFYYE